MCDSYTLESSKTITEVDTAVVAARASDASSERLRKQLAAFTASVRSSTAAGGSTPTDGGTDVLDLLTGLLGRIGDAAGRLAEFADASHIAGLACECSYDALNKSDGI
ncbi:DUF2514 family protein [Pandoraea pulmonicola]|uniref:DUF2514 family protein n=1 Tax=Pandoraea pulmonicola TaxID=93221 RepID=UPI00093513B0